MTRAAVLILALLAALPAEAETLVATRTIRAMAEIGPDDVTLMAGHTPGALSSPAEAVGLEARSVLYAGRPIRPGDVGPAATVERNGIVPLVFSRGGLTILAEGRALGRGAPGEVIRVMNLSSRTTVQGRIGPDGAVHVAGSAGAFP
jgi:flagella basal body P-ring formation protein FlgA